MQRRADTFPVHVRTRPSLSPMSTYPVRVFGDPVLKQKAKDVTMTGLDLDGNEVVIEGDELLGRVFLHELDHLDGVLMLDRLDPDERKRALRELRDVDLRAAGLERIDDVRRL